MKLKYICLLLFVYSCKNDLPLIKDYMNTNYSDVFMKKIIFDNSLININKNINSYNFNENNSVKLLFTGKMNCSPCVIKLKEIEHLLNAKKNLDKVEVIYLGIGEQSEYFNYQVQLGNFSYYIFSDQNSNFINENELFKYENSTFLLNKNNEVILVGDLINNEVLERYYSTLIDENI